MSGNEILSYVGGFIIAGLIFYTAVKMNKITYLNK